MYALLLTVLVAGCSSAAEQAAPALPPGDRIVSIDYCADQMLLGLVPRARIAAVSYEAAADPLFSGRLAAGLPRVRPDVERILALRPTLVVRSYAGGPRLEHSLRRAGVRVFTLPYAARLVDVAPAIAASGVALDAEAAAAARLRRFARDSVAAAPRRRGLYLTPGDYTAGQATLIDDIMRHAGVRNIEARGGWHRIDAERIVAQPPDLVIRAFGESAAHRTDRWSGSDNLALTRTLASSVAVELPGSWLACGNWRAGHAIARLRAAADQ